MNELELFKDFEKKNDDKLLSYVPSVFLTAGIPLRSIKKNIFKRKYNDITMYMQSVTNLPYGKYARLLLSLFTTYAVLNGKKGQEVQIRYKNCKNLLDELRLPKQRTSEIMQQLENFSHTIFSYERRVMKKISGSLFTEYDLDPGNYTATAVKYENIPFIRKFMYIDCEKDSESHPIAFEIDLSDDFVDMCKEHAVPIDYTVYSQISSPLGKDLYAWLIYRNNYLKEGEDIFIPSEQLVNQFIPVSEGKNTSVMYSSNYGYIKTQLSLIKEKYYQNLRLDIMKDGILLKKSPPVIMGEDKRYTLVTSIKKEFLT